MLFRKLDKIVLIVTLLFVVVFIVGAFLKNEDIILISIFEYITIVGMIIKDKKGGRK